ncbi:MAG: MBL fold metallo-hydrolase [Chloroflexi bacterium]|nr:MBL fold metallo-hydrolase [Chloroflexota bacterium]
MIPIVEVAKGIFRIGPLETFARTPNTSPYLVVGEERAAIMEIGEEGQVAALLQAIRHIGVGYDRIAYFISSHIHLHHVAGLNLLLHQLPQAKMVAHRRAVPHLVEPTRLNEGTFAVWGPGCPSLYPVPENRIWGVTGGEIIDLGGRQLEIIDATGHAPHHLAIFDRLTRALFPGDAVGTIRLGKERARPDILPPLFDIERAIETLRRLRALKPSVLFLFGYGGVSHSPDKTLQWGEEDVRAIEGIVRKGMRQKVGSQEIGRRVRAYYDQIGTREPTEDEEVVVPEGGPQGAGAPIGMCAYLHREDPSLEMPQ